MLCKIRCGWDLGEGLLAERMPKSVVDFDNLGVSHDDFHLVFLTIEWSVDSGVG